MLKKELLLLPLLACIFFIRAPLYRSLQAGSSYLCMPFIYFNHYFLDPCKQVQTDTIVLQQAYDELLNAHIKLQATADYHDAIKELITFKERYEHNKAQLAQIIARHIGPDEQYLLIDKGSRHGVHERMVLVYKDMLVGRVIEVFPCYSKAVLITDERCKVGAYCARTQAEGVCKGCNNVHVLELAHVSHLEDIERGDLIVSSGQGLIFPRGFGIARVAAYEKDDLVYQVSCEPLCDMHAINYCYLIEKSS